MLMQLTSFSINILCQHISDDYYLHCIDFQLFPISARCLPINVFFPSPSYCTVLAIYQLRNRAPFSFNTTLIHSSENLAENITHIHTHLWLMNSLQVSTEAWCVLNNESEILILPKYRMGSRTLPQEPRERSSTSRPTVASTGNITEPAEKKWFVALPQSFAESRGEQKDKRITSAPNEILVHLLIRLCVCI